MGKEDKKILLKVLGIEVPVNDNIEYHDDGFVSSIEVYKKRLLKRYNNNTNNLNKDCSGTFGRFESDGKIHHHIAYLNQEHNSLNIQTRAHEETHVLDSLGYLDLLEKKIIDEFMVGISFGLIKCFDNFFKDKSEIIAEIGGIYALCKSGISPENIKNFVMKILKSH